MEIFNNIRRWAETDWIAAISEDRVLTFAELERRSEALAAKMIDTYRRGETIGLWGDKENDMICYIFACMKSGHPYLILPSYFPQERVQQIINIARPVAVFCAAPFPFALENVPVYSLNEVEEMVASYSGQHISEEQHMHSGDVVTYFFTSGSTGVPKCVPATFDAVDNICEAYGAETAKYIEEDLRCSGEKQLAVLNLESYAFCSSIDIIISHCGQFGMILYAVSHDQVNDFKALYQYISRVNPVTFDCSPQFLSMCLMNPDFKEENFSNMRMLSVGGENLSRRIGREFLRRFPHVALCNGYGATEMCAGPMWCVITEDLLDCYDVMPIGVPIADFTCHIEDENGKEILEDGVAGELVVEGCSVAQGYLNDPEKTEKVFCKDENGVVHYHTNDLVTRHDGQFFYVGRKDNLAKVGGYRVELEEVEEHISRLENVKSCAVVPVTKEGRTVMLMAYIVPEEMPTSTLQAVQTIRHQLLQMLQPYMVPQKIKFVNTLPLNPNGKVDRYLLKDQSILN